MNVPDGTVLSGEIRLPASYNGKAVTRIAGGGFSDQTGITSVILPSTFSDLGQKAFFNCSNLKSVYIEKYSSYLDIKLKNAISVSTDVFTGHNEYFFIVVPNDETSSLYRKNNRFEAYYKLIFSQNKILEEGQSDYAKTTDTVISFLYLPQNDGFHHFFDVSVPTAQVTLQDYLTREIIASGEGNLYNQVLEKDCLYIIEISLPSQASTPASFESHSFSPTEYENLSQTIVITDFDLENLGDLEWLYWDKTYQHLYLPVLQAVYDNVENLDEEFMNELMMEYAGYTLLLFIDDTRLLHPIFSGGYESVLNGVSRWGVYSLIIRLENSVRVYFPKGIGATYTSARDSYSLGFHIAQSYVDDLDDDIPSWIRSMNFDYYPVIAPSSYRNDLNFLLGMSHVLGCPVKIVSTIEELEKAMEYMEYQGLVIDEWIFVEPEILLDYGDDMELLDAFGELGYDITKLYYYIRVIDSFTVWLPGDQKYLISDRNSVSDLMWKAYTDFIESNMVYAEDFRQWMFEEVMEILSPLGIPFDEYEFRDWLEHDETVRLLMDYNGITSDDDYRALKRRAIYRYWQSHYQSWEPYDGVDYTLYIEQILTKI